LPPDATPWPEDWGSAKKPEAPAKTVETVVPVVSVVSAKTVMPVGSTVPVGSTTMSLPPRTAYAGASPQLDRKHNDRKFAVHDAFDFTLWLAKFTLAAYMHPRERAARDDRTGVFRIVCEPEAL
jgi:hypothetical protein